MQNQKIILFDFDGVIVNGMAEYWHSSLIACKNYLFTTKITNNLNLNKKISPIFINIRPLVKYGWEMVLITHEIIKKNNPLDDLNKELFIQNYEKNCKDILRENSWNAEYLQSSLDNARKEQIKHDLDQWISLHKPFLEVLQFMRKVKKNGYKIGIISTKGQEFTRQILNQISVFPDLIYGYEAGPKSKILTKLTLEYRVIGFIEDRRQTLINLLSNELTRDIPYYLADWGYLKKTDRIKLPNEIKLLKLKNLDEMLANST